MEKQQLTKLFDYLKDTTKDKNVYSESHTNKPSDRKNKKKKGGPK